MTIDHYRPTRRAFLGHGAATLASMAGLGLPGHAAAQAAVEQLHVLCSGPAGSIPDIVARRIAEQMSGRFAQRLTVENRPGAAGQIAINALKSARPTASTLLLAQARSRRSHPAFYAKLAYDPVLDLQPVSLAGEMTLALAIGPGGARDGATAELGLMRWNPKLACLPGTGTLPHPARGHVARQAGAPWQHIVYFRWPPAIYRPGWADHRAGAARAACSASTGYRPVRARHPRSSYFPDVATLAEQGYRELVVREWFVLHGGGVSTATIEATSEALRTAIAWSELAAASPSPACWPRRARLGAGRAHAAEQRYWQPIVAAPYPGRLMAASPSCRGHRHRGQREPCLGPGRAGTRTPRSSAPGWPRPPTRCCRLRASSRASGCSTSPPARATRRWTSRIVSAPRAACWPPTSRRPSSRLPTRMPARPACAT
jgi:tripartite-type tricarboxylate transporter receptor subunit TctC